MRKTFITGLVAAGLIGAGVGFASPAHATTLVNNGNGTVAVSGLNAANDLVHLCASSVSAITCANELLGDGVTVAVISFTQGDGTYGVGSTVFVAAGSVTGPLTAGTYTMVPFSSGSYTPGTELLNVLIGGGSSASGETHFGPADEIQQVGQPASGCENLSLPLLDWAGVSSGGWAPSWAEWVNGGLGGPVCTRTLAFSTSGNAWFVRP